MSPSNNRGFRQLLADCIELVRSWWQVDRIRISPREGRLLRLRAGSLLEFRNRHVEVVGRRVRQNGPSVTIVYDCRSAGKDARLVVFSTPECDCRLLSWFQGGRVRRIDENEITVYR